MTTRKTLYAIAFALAASMTLAVGAFAEGLKDSQKSVIPGVPVAKSWTGVGVGVHAAWGTEAVDLGGPNNLGTEGPTLGGSAIAMVQLQQFVLGFEGGWSKYFGDPEKIGLNHSLELTGLVGVAMGNVLPYAHATPWKRIDTDFGNVDGYGFGAGVMFRPEGSKIIWDARFTRGVFDDAANSGFDAKTNEVRLGVKYLFQYR